jgi:hypothetical protein
MGHPPGVAVVSSHRPVSEVRSELAELQAYIEGIPPYLAATGYLAPYKTRAEQLKQELLFVEAATHASQLEAPIHLFRLTRSWAESHVVPLEFLGHLCRCLFSLASAAFQSSDERELGQAPILALPAMSGSYAFGIAVRHDGSQQFHRALRSCFQLEPDLPSLRTQLAAVPQIDRSAYKTFLSLIAENDFEVEMSYLPLGADHFVDAVKLSPHMAISFVRLFSETEIVEAPRSISGTVVGASQTRSRLEVRERGGRVVSATVEDPQILKGLRIGGKYAVQLRETTTTESVTEKVSVTELVVSLAPVVEQGTSSAPDEGGQDLLPSELFPEGNDPDKIHLLVKELLRTTSPKPETIGVSSQRWINYYRASARILGLVTASGTLTRHGKVAARAPKDEFMSLFAMQFKVSDVGQAWLEWANVTSLSQLDPKSAEAFITSISEGLSESNVKRRASTLRAWLKKLPENDKAPGAR